MGKNKAALGPVVQLPPLQPRSGVQAAHRQLIDRFVEKLLLQASSIGHSLRRRIQMPMGYESTGGCKRG